MTTTRKRHVGYKSNSRKCKWDSSCQSPREKIKLNLVDTRYYSWRACRDVGGDEAVIDQETIESVTMLAPYTRTGAIVMEIKHK